MALRFSIWQPEVAEPRWAAFWMFVSSAFPRQQHCLELFLRPRRAKDLYSGPTDRFVADCATNYNEYLAYSPSIMPLTKTNITFRRDGCGGAVHSNERVSMTKHSANTGARR